MKAFATLFIGACLLASTEQGWAQCAGPAPFLLPPVSPLASAPVSHEDDTAKLEVGQQIVAMLWPQERLEAQVSEVKWGPLDHLQRMGSMDRQAPLARKES